jgi:hypothetical protein
MKAKSWQVTRTARKNTNSNLKATTGPKAVAKTALSESSSPSPEGEEAAVLVLERWKMSAKAGAQAGSVA